MIITIEELKDLQSKYEECKKQVTINVVSEMLNTNVNTLKMFEKELGLDIKENPNYGCYIYNLTAIELFKEIISMRNHGFTFQEIDDVIKRTGRDKIDAYMMILNTKQKNNISTDNKRERVKDGKSIQDTFKNNDEMLQEKYIKYGGEAVPINIVAEILEVDVEKLKVYEKELRLELGKPIAYAYELDAIQQFKEIIDMKERGLPLYVIRDAMNSIGIERYRKYKVIMNTVDRGEKGDKVIMSDMP